MSDIDFIFQKYDSTKIASLIAQNLRQLRIAQNLTQEELAEHSGVSLSSLKRFEQKAEISLTSLLKLAVSLDATENFNTLFVAETPNSLDGIIKEKEKTNRKRARK